MKRKVLALACVALLAGCGSAFPRQPADASPFDRQLAPSGYLSDSDLLSAESSRQFAAARNFVHDRQCASGNANPLVYISLPLGAEAQGAGRAAGGRPELPLRVSTVANFPNEYLRDMAALADTKGVPGEVAQKLRRDMSANYELLSLRVRSLINEFDPAQCPRRGRYGAMWIESIVLPPTY